MRRILITAALPYANAPLHFGHLGGVYLPADIYARFERLLGSQVLFISGSDEYGVAITLSAELEGRSPQDHVDFYHKEHKRTFEKLNILFDLFSRTTDPLHSPLVVSFFSDLLENKYIEEREVEQLYSEKENRFLADRYVIGICPSCGFEEARGDECGKCGTSFEATDLKSPRSKLTHSPLVARKTSHYYLLLDRFSEKLSHFLDGRAWRSNVLNFARNYLNEIRARAITRDLEWGVPVPGKKDKVFYVWFDAPIGYITASQAWAKAKGKPDAWKDYWLKPDTHYVQFVGKDNIPFHALFFPAMIMGQNAPYKQVDDLVGSEFYNLEGKKFSKSEGWTLDLEETLSRYQVDQIRYVLTSTAPETGDSEFTWKEFQSRCNAELVGKFGNLIHRTLVFIQNNCGAKIPVRHELGEHDLRFLNTISRLTQEIKERYSDYRFRKASQLIMELAQEGNSYFDQKAPWRDAKDPMRRPFMETTINLCLEAIKALALTAYPIIPKSAEKIWELIGEKSELSNERWEAALERLIAPETPLPKPTPLFLRVEDDMIEEELTKLNKLHEKALVKTPHSAPIKPPITLDDFYKIDLRVGLIVKAEKVPKSKKLLRLEVDMGPETRVILSGISEHYTAESIVGKKVAVIANLQPAKIMGIESQGMILAGSLDNALELLTVTDLPAGAEIS